MQGVHGGGARVGRALLKETGTMFARWHRVRDGTLAPSQFRREMGPQHYLLNSYGMTFLWTNSKRDTKPDTKPDTKHKPDTKP